jgi:hypothetical protein
MALALGFVVALATTPPGPVTPTSWIQDALWLGRRSSSVPVGVDRAPRSAWARIGAVMVGVGWAATALGASVAGAGRGRAIGDRPGWGGPVYLSGAIGTSLGATALTLSSRGRPRIQPIGGKRWAGLAIRCRF